MIDNSAIRAQFPILKITENGKPLVFLDSASTSQKPLRVIEATDKYYREQNSNVHRGVYGLSERATDAFEGVREKVRALLNAETAKQIIFTRGATEAINLVANTWGRANLTAEDEIIISEMEHHSNLVPWQLLREQLGFKIIKWPINDLGELDLALLPDLVTAKTKLVAVTGMSNALGTINPVKEIIEIAHQAGAKVLVDGAQATSHMQMDVQALGVDFLVFSGHKMYAPTGVGCLYGKLDLLEAMPPFLGGGDMIYEVSFEKSSFNVLPYKFEAGTPNIAGVIGLGAAIDFINEIGFATISAIENDLLAYATEQLQKIPGLTIIGQAKNKGSVVSFVVENAHPHDLATLLDQDGVAVRASHHCAMPVMTKFGVPATVRASFGVYNTRAEIDILVASLKDAIEMLA